MFIVFWGLSAFFGGMGAYNYSYDQTLLVVICIAMAILAFGLGTMSFEDNIKRKLY